jgi:hypothetical protein
MNEKFRASSIKNPFFPDTVEFSEKGITFKIRKAVSSRENFVFYNDIAGVEIDSGIFWATIRIKAKAREEDIIITNFSKGDAKKVKQLILDRAHEEPLRS